MEKFSFVYGNMKITIEPVETFQPLKNPTWVASQGAATEQSQKAQIQKQSVAGTGISKLGQQSLDWDTDYTKPY